MKDMQSSVDVQSLTDGVEETFKNRITGVVFQRAGDFLPTETNPRDHSDYQEELTAKALRAQGKLDALKAYKDEEGNWRLFDGHMRQDIDPDEPWVILLTDLTPVEAREASVTFDFLGEYADLNLPNLEEIMQGWETNDDDLMDVVMGVHGADTILDAVGANDDLMEMFEPRAGNAPSTGVTDTAVPGSQYETGEDRHTLFDGGGLPDAPQQQETQRSRIIYVAFKTEETFSLALKLLSQERNRNLQLPGQMFATIDGEKNMQTYIDNLAMEDMEADITAVEPFLHKGDKDTWINE